MIGQTVSHYRITKQLGAGGMGVVYQALDLKLERPVALKFLPPDLTRDPEAKARFVHEARAASALDHPNICNVHEIDETDDGRLFIAMACYEGETLKERIARGPLPLDEAIEIAQQVTQGLAKAHEQEIVHRDIKPANIFITKDGLVKIVDFGLAKLAGQTRMTRTGSALGTVAYMSPEQARGGAVGPPTDIWSLGVVCYEMLAGQLPFRGDRNEAVIYSILSTDPMPLSKLRPGLAPRLEETIERCLEKDPLRRYANAGELLTAIETLATELALGIHSRRSLSLRRWRRTRRTRLALAAAAIVVAAAVMLRLFMTQQRGIDSVAVLPLVNISGEPGQEYFVDGMTDELIGQLGKVHALNVISRTSSMRYKGAEQPLPEIARALHVGAIMEGSVRREGDRVRISLDLVNARTDRSMWSDTYDLMMADVFAVQRDVALKVVQALKAALSSEERDKLEPSRPVSTEAYQLYLKGNFFLNKFAEEETRRAIRYYEQACEVDSNYAAPYSGLSIAFWSLSIYGHVSPEETYPKARAYALKALELDDSSAKAHAMLAGLSMYDWDWKTGDKEFRRAFEIGPGTVDDHDRYAFFLLYVNRLDEAAAQEMRAVELDPLDVAVHQNLGEVLYYARRYDESIKASLETLDMEPTFPQAHMFLGMAYAAKGMTEEAVKALDRERELSGGQKPQVESWIGVGYALAGQTEQTRRIYANMLQQLQNEFVSPFPLACICFVLGDIDQGFAWLEEGFNRHDPRMSFLKVHPACDGVRADPRYLDCLKRMGFES
jgi:TolB-like protein/Tfp pilus assembly protein PilF